MALVVSNLIWEDAQENSAGILRRLSSGATWTLSPAQKESPPVGAPGLSAYQRQTGSASPVQKWRFKLAALKLVPGECILIQGGPGSGKTLALQLLSGLIKPVSGFISIDQDVSARAAFLSAPSSAVLPGSKPLAWAYEGEKEHSPRLYQIFCEQLKRFSVYESFVDRAASQLSLKELRKIALASLCLSKGSYLCIDEPLALLAPEEYPALLDLLQSLRQQGRALILAAQSCDELLAHTDGLVLLHEGMVAWQGPSAHVLDHPAIFRLAELEPPQILAYQEYILQQGSLPFAFTLDPLELQSNVDAALAEFDEAEKLRLKQEFSVKNVTPSLLCSTFADKGPHDLRHCIPSCFYRTEYRLQIYLSCMVHRAHDMIRDMLMRVRGGFRRKLK